MKTMKLGSEIKRFSDKEAEKKLNDGWSYCPKSEWKAVRVVEKPTKEEDPETTKKNKGNPKGKARKKIKVSNE